MRIHIIGPPGSGKTILARRLVSRHGLVAHDLDWIAYDEEGERDPAARDSDVISIVAADNWVTEGTYVGWVTPLIEHADYIIWLDVPWLRTCWRMLKRHALAELRRDNRHPGWRRLLRFMRYTRGYFRESTDPVPGIGDPIAEPTSTRVATQNMLRPYSAKVVRCGTTKDIDAWLDTLDRS